MPPKLSKYQLHRARWAGCKLCDLCVCRKNVVLLRGTVPSPVLFVGEAPGPSEDVLATPFVGPAGQLLDRIIARAGGDPKRLAFTNLIACIPLDDNQEKFTKPPKYAIDACANRLKECVRLVDPKLLVWVGQEAGKYGPQIIDWGTKWMAYVIHPAAILRAHVAQQGLMVQRAIVTLADAFEEVL